MVNAHDVDDVRSFAFAVSRAQSQVWIFIEWLNKRTKKYGEKQNTKRRKERSNRKEKIAFCSNSRDDKQKLISTNGSSLVEFVHLCGGTYSRIMAEIDELRAGGDGDDRFRRDKECEPRFFCHSGNIRWSSVFEILKRNLIIFCQGREKNDRANYTDFRLR